MNADVKGATFVRLSTTHLENRPHLPNIINENCMKIECHRELAGWLDGWTDREVDKMRVEMVQEKK